MILGRMDALSTLNTQHSAFPSYQAYLQKLQHLLESLPLQTLQQITDELHRAFQEGRHVLLMGNGGSGTTASHINNDFQKCIYEVTGKPFRSLALTDATPLILAWANDSEYANIFLPQIETWVQPGDVVIGISGSGNSENVVRAISRAREMGAVTIGLCGFDGGRLAQTAEIVLHVPSHNMQQIEDVHMVVLHMVFSDLRDRVAGG